MLSDYLMLGGVTVLALLPAASSATTLYVTSTDGGVNGLRLDAKTLKGFDTKDGCGTNGSRLTPDITRDRIYCLDEALKTSQGTLASFKINTDGTMSFIESISTVRGGVGAVKFGTDSKGLAIAHNSDSAVSTVNIATDTLATVQTENFKLAKPGPKAQQSAAHPSSATLDPSGAFLFVPDLGADLIRILSVDSAGLTFTDLNGWAVTAGSGPSRGVFVSGENGTLFYYFLGELDNTITGYQVTYPASGAPEGEQIYRVSTHGDGWKAPTPETAAADIQVSPDGRYLYVSSRGEGTLSIPNPNGGSPATVESDPIIVFSISPSDGKLQKVQEAAAGGKNPRHFSINKAGTQVAVALQDDGRVVVINRDVATGKLLDFQGSWLTFTNPTSVIFWE